MHSPSSLVTTMVASACLAVPLALAPLQPASAVPAEVPPSEKVVVDLVTVVGSGCPRGTTSVSVSPGNTLLSLGFSDFIAGVGAGMKITDFRKTCQLSLMVHAPSGFTYAVPAVRYSGYAYLEPGASASLRTSSYFSGLTDTRLIKHPLVGPFDNDWTFQDTPGLSDLMWAPCGEPRNLNVNTELRVKAGTSDVTTKTSYIVLDSLGNNDSASFRLEWKRCPV
jgi:hypothetical protein